ncbi:hypothetical protein Q9233_001250 [Columba guinea]|nr:hypothetical protein Q9233_001250 [Columba guinea]
MDNLSPAIGAQREINQDHQLRHYVIAMDMSVECPQGKKKLSQLQSVNVLSINSRTMEEALDLDALPQPALPVQKSLQEKGRASSARQPVISCIKPS